MYDSEGNRMLNENMEPYTYSKWAQITDLMRLEIVYNNGGCIILTLHLKY